MYDIILLKRPFQAMIEIQSFRKTNDCTHVINLKNIFTIDKLIVYIYYLHACMIDSPLDFGSTEYAQVYYFNHTYIYILGFGIMRAYLKTSCSRHCHLQLHLYTEHVYM